MAADHVSDEDVKKLNKEKNIQLLIWEKSSSSCTFV